MAHGITRSDSMMSVRRVPWHGLGAVLGRAPPHPRRRARGFRSDLGGRQGAALPPRRPPRRRPLRHGARATPSRSSASSPTTTSSCRTATASPSSPTCSAPSSSSRRPGRCGAESRCSSPPRCPTTSRSAATTCARTSCSRAWHTGTGAIRAMTTPVRAVCANTVRAALERARAVYRVRHVGDPTGQLHEARAVLGMTVDYYRQFAAFGDRLALQPMSERALRDVLARALPARHRARRPRPGQPPPRPRGRPGRLRPRRHGRQRAGLEVVCVERDRRGPRPPRPAPARPRARSPARSRTRRGLKARALELVLAA